MSRSTGFPHHARIFEHLVDDAADQPVRAVKLAQLVAQLACRLVDAPHGTRVLPPEVLQQARQMAEAWDEGADVCAPPAR